MENRPVKQKLKLVMTLRSRQILSSNCPCVPRVCSCDCWSKFYGWMPFSMCDFQFQRTEDTTVCALMAM